MTEQQQFRSIHFLRGVAAMMVVVCHTFSYGLISDMPRDSAIWMKHGVAIFFVISGFVMVVSTRKRPGDPVDFIKRRLLRIVPMYWVATLVLFATGIAHSDDWQRLIPSLLFLPTLAPGSGKLLGPVLEVGWTLYLEMGFYLLFAATMLLPRRAGLGITVALLCLAVAMAAAFPANPWLEFYARPALVNFASGMLIAWTGMRLPAWCAVAGFAAMAWCANSASANYALAVTIPSLLIVAGALGAEPALSRLGRRASRVFTALGDASYAIYLMHFPTFYLMVFLLAGHSAPLVVGVPLALVLSALVGVLVHRLVEQPLADFMAGGLNKKTAQALPT